ncbi:hypothetical protein ONA91_01275 [Micromonospora sp. DR5-3]|uniref:hypothetical protein n=1 Tax=unclassified Micromonospora TaxID=2617518 RepID=UPI0011DB28C6|nr:MULTISPECIES: hypothetical protein [unclassified Micromonospora]MCW3813090.1 hypothetical protein [Micromonospora sp. DR5-3]TYC25927.1 hypothetical protein FXF52_00690 [Micromonospora sp. MP36]
MRMTVGPLPPAVYWRRRAVVFGAGLLFLIVLLYSCANPDPKNTNATGVDPSSKASAPAAQPTGSVLTPTSDSPSPTPGDAGGGSDAGQSGGASNDVPAAPVVDDGTCADSEIKVTPVAVPATAQQQTMVTLRLKIKNVSTRTCSRDVGADLQELFVKAGAEKVWSSDTCGTGKGSDVQSFTPNFERFYELGWNSRYSTKCANGLADGPYAQPGTYQVFARVGTKLSDPVKLTITG